MKKDELLNYAKEVLKHEGNTILSLIERIDEEFFGACELIKNCKGRVVTTGMGKAGIIAQKISATLSSTGTPSLFLHPAEAFHGDIGRVVQEDVILVLSNSGATEEITRLLPLIKKIGAKIVSITSKDDSPLAKYSDVVLDMGRIEEACPFGLAPSASTTAMLALGDALSLAVLKMKNLNKEQYAAYHPGGALGKKLLKVQEVMRTGEELPVVSVNETLRNALISLMHIKRRSGAICVVDENKKLCGIFTDADIRRKLETGDNILEEPVSKIITRNPKVITKDKLATESAYIMKKYKIDELPVVDEEFHPIGIVDIQDLLEVGLI